MSAYKTQGVKKLSHYSMKNLHSMVVRLGLIEPLSYH